MRDSRSLEMLEILATYGPTREDPFFPARKHPCTGITLAKQEPNRPRNRSGRAFLDPCVAEVPRAIRILPVHPGANSLLTTQKSKHFVVRVFAYPPTTTDTRPATKTCSSTSYVVRAKIAKAFRATTCREIIHSAGHQASTAIFLILWHS
jgi:hypothetical protein